MQRPKTLGLMVGLDPWTWRGPQETQSVSGIWQTVKEKASGYEGLLCPRLETQAPIWPIHTINYLGSFFKTMNAQVPPHPRTLAAPGVMWHSQGPLCLFIYYKAKELTNTKAEDFVDMPAPCKPFRISPTGTRRSLDAKEGKTELCLNHSIRK